MINAGRLMLSGAFFFEGGTKGKAILAALTARWNIAENDYFTVRGRYLKLDTNGTQSQT